MGASSESPRLAPDRLWPEASIPRGPGAGWSREGESPPRPARPCGPVEHRHQERRRRGRSCPGLPGPRRPQPPPLSHPVCRWLLILIVVLRMVPQRASPMVFVLTRPPRGAVNRDHGLRGLGECRDAPGARIAALGNLTAILQGLLPSLGQRHDRIGAEADVCPASWRTPRIPKGSPRSRTRSSTVTATLSCSLGWGSRGGGRRAALHTKRLPILSAPRNPIPW